MLKSVVHQEILSTVTWFRLVVTQYTVSGCCNFLAQFILVRTTWWCLLTLLVWIKCKSPDIPLLDCVGPQHWCCDNSFHPSIRFLRSVNPFIHSLILIRAASNSDTGRFCPATQCTREIFYYSCLGYHSELDLLGHLDCRKCSGDRINCVQNLQGVPGNQDYCGRPNFGHDRREKTSAYRIRTNWIWHAIILYPNSSTTSLFGKDRRCHWCLCAHRWFESTSDG